MMGYVSESVENIVEKEELRLTCIFSFFIPCFSQSFFLRVVKTLSSFQFCSIHDIQHILTLSQTTSFRLFQTERGCRHTISALMKMEESSPNGWKTLWEKEKLLVTSNFSFSHSVFKRLQLQTRKNHGLFGKGLIKRGDLP